MKINRNGKNMDKYRRLCIIYFLLISLKEILVKQKMYTQGTKNVYTF